MQVIGFAICGKLFLIISFQRTERFSKVSLKYAVQEHTPTHEYVLSLNKPAKLTNVQKMMEKYKHG